MEKVVRIFLFDGFHSQCCKNVNILILHPAGEEEDEEEDDDEIEGGTKRAAEDDDDDEEVRKSGLHH